tara:strand:- start:12360 stop:12668 length:309 start_codon:yes stop_codon:yes gene_type:complete
MYRGKEECCCYPKIKQNVIVDHFEENGFAMKKDIFYFDLKDPIIVSTNHNIKRHYKNTKKRCKFSTYYKYTKKCTIKTDKKREKRKSLWNWLWRKKEKDNNQ